MVAKAPPIVKPILALLSAVGLACFLLLLLAQGTSLAQTTNPVNFGKSTLGGETLTNPTSLQFGPDGRLYVAQQNGLIKAYTVKRNGANSYSITNTETIDLVNKIPNHNDDGTLNTSVTGRQVTGILVTGTAAQPMIYVGSSDPRIGAGGSGTDLNLDTNSGIISKLTKGSSGWTKQDLVRGLSRSEENHSINGLQLSGDGKTLYTGAGGNTNQGAPSNNFALLPEYALSAVILKVDLATIGDTTYDLPTLAGTSQPFGGNDGMNQAKLVAGGPVQVYAPGFRNAYDLVVSEGGKMYTIDNGGNAGWGALPIGEGPGGTCTNEVNEPGETNSDQLHLITGAGYYGGHPNPTRANKANTFGGSSPVEVSANPIECDYNKPGPALSTFYASTNGLDEYTASNFGGAMKGNLLAASFDNNLYRVQLNSAGDSVTKNAALFTAVGSNPLDVTAQGGSDPFPGTIWVADIYGGGDGNVVVFEPADYGGGGGTTCDTSNPSGDADGDGYTNQDEQASGTDPCNQADVPPDWDKDKISNLNDPDDDNDGQLDTKDPFARDAQNGKGKGLSVRYDFDSTTNVNADGPFKLGFTGLMTNGYTDYQKLYDENNLTVGGAAGVLTVDQVSEGDAYSTYNNQENAFQFGVDPATGSGGTFTARVRVAAPFNGITPQDYQSMGISLGPGDQDNYVKLVTSSNAGKGGIEFAQEVGGQFWGSSQPSVPMPGPDYVDLYLTVDPSSNTVQPSYVVSTGGKEGERTNLGSPVSVPASWLDGTKALAVGVNSTSFGAAPPFAATWDFIEVTLGNGGTQPPADTTAPTISSVTPAADATSVAANTNVDAVFSEAMNSSTITSSTFTLTKQGSSTPVAATVSYDSQANRATLNPTSDLEAGATYTATIKGGSGGVKDAAGNALAQDKTWSFAVASPTDTTPPETTITSGPSGTVKSRTATFGFSSSESGSTFECSIDGASYSGCTSPKQYSSLANGSHTFRVRATDAAGNTDTSPASRTWKVNGAAK